MAAGYRRMLAMHDDALIEDGAPVQINVKPVRQGLLDEADLMSRRPVRLACLHVHSPI